VSSNVWRRDCGGRDPLSIATLTIANRETKSLPQVAPLSKIEVQGEHPAIRPGNIDAPPSGGSLPEIPMKIKNIIGILASFSFQRGLVDGAREVKWHERGTEECGSGGSGIGEGASAMLVAQVDDGPCAIHRDRRRWVIQRRGDLHHEVHEAHEGKQLLAIATAVFM